MSGEFVDTNVLVYAHDTSAGTKRDQAIQLIERLAETRQGLLSAQVLMEFYHTITRKVPRPLPPALAREVLADFGCWATFSPRTSDIIQAGEIAERYRISFWDALIIHAAGAMGADVIWSEDLNAGQRYLGIPLQSPFAFEAPCP
jgi:predicted nucleic acid-binding protein